MDIVLRLNEFLEFKNVKKNQFYVTTGISNGYLNKVKSIGTDKLRIIIAHYPTLNVNWLLTGKGNMILSHKQMMILKGKAIKDKSKENHTQLNEPNVVYNQDNKINNVTLLNSKIEHLTDKIKLIRDTINDKESIIELQSEIIKRSKLKI